MTTLSAARQRLRDILSPTLGLALLFGSTLATPSLAADVAALKAEALSKEMTPRRKALKALVADGSPAAVEAMLEAAKTAATRKDTVGVRDVAHHLKSLQSPDAAPVLLRALEAKDLDVKTMGQSVVEALGNTRDPSAAPALRGVLSREDQKPMHRKAYAALAKVTDDPADVSRFAADLKERSKASDAVSALRGLENPKLAKSLYPLLKDPAIENNSLKAVIDALGRMAVPEAAVPLLDVVERDERNGAASWASQALVSCAEPEHVPRMQKIITGQKGKVSLHDAFVAADRRQGHKALKGLLKNDPHLAAQLLNKIVNYPHPSDEALALAALGTKPNTRVGDPIRSTAVVILGKLGGDKATSTLCSVLKDKGNYTTLRTGAVEGLGRAATDDAVRCLIDVLEAESKLKAQKSRQFSINVHEDAARALQRISGEKLGEDPKAWRTWHSSGLKAGLDGLVAGLAHQDESARTLSAQRLRDKLKKGEVKSDKDRQKAKDALVAATEKERKTQTRVAMVEALGALRDPAAVPVLVSVLESSGSRSFEEKVALASALDGLGDGRGTATLIEQLSSEKDDDREEAARALSLVTGEPLHYDANKWRAWWKTYGERYRR